MQGIIVPIRNRKVPDQPRIFDVEVDLEGNIIRYITKNIKGTSFVDTDDVQAQIKEALIARKAS